MIFLFACTDYSPTPVECEPRDLDADGYSSNWIAADGKSACPDILGAADCDDGDAAVHPGAMEICDGRDNDCNGVVDDDEDADGWCVAEDCDDLDAAVNPDATERCNEVDDDCNGVADDGLDLDGDGVSSCDGDCDDSRVDVNPLVEEACDGLDNDCDGNVLPEGEADGDGDGWLRCEDCDDGDDAVHPGATEQCNGIDDDCSGSVDALEEDADGDGSLACADCDDTDGDVWPGAPERCDGEDDDCDGEIDNGWDADGDGFFACVDDCDDADGSAYPGAPESCNERDDDCDGLIPVTESDLDGDGVSECDGDCSPLDADVHPGAAELCDGLDQDCDGVLGADEEDVDADGARACDDCDDADAFLNRLDLDRDGNDSCDGDCDDLDAGLDALDHDGDGTSLCGGDCDDDDDGRSPALAELCDFADNDCDGTVDEGFVDLDGNGSPECVEVCNGLDDDSDGFVDEGYTDGSLTGVWVDVTLPGGDGTVAAPFASIQDAVDARSPVDPCVIYVRAGTYYEQVTVDGGLVMVEALDGPELTTLHGGGAGTVFDAQSTDDGSRLQGFTITGGAGSSGGGGVRVQDGALDILDNEIRDNEQVGPGGGIYCRDCTGTISGNVVADNVADFPDFDFGTGAGIAVMYSGSAPEIEANEITGNVLTSTYGFGAGIGLWAAGEVLIQHNLVAQNSSSYDGGGIAVRDGSVGRVYNNVVMDNEALSDEQVGSGVSLQGDDSSWLVNNTIVLNRGGFAQVNASWNQGTAYLAANIIAWADAAGIGSQGGPTPQIVYNDLWETTGYDGVTDVTGTNGNIEEDPMFVLLEDDGVPDDDLSLTPGSPCIDAGPTTSTFDDPDGTRNDMGAFGGPGGGW